MISGIASLVFIPLLAIAVAHMIWAFGGSYPARTQELLVRTVIGVEGRERVPRLASALIALAILAAGIVALSLADPSPGGPMLGLGLGFALVFLGRGAIGYTKSWQARTPIEPFRTMDRKFYSPLCLALGVGFIFLIVWRFM